MFSATLQKLECNTISYDTSESSNTCYFTFFYVNLISILFKLMILRLVK